MEENAPYHLETLREMDKLDLNGLFLLSFSCCLNDAVNTKWTRLDTYHKLQQGNKYHIPQLIVCTQGQLIPTVMET